MSSKSAWLSACGWRDSVARTIRSVTLTARTRSAGSTALSSSTALKTSKGHFDANPGHHHVGVFALVRGSKSPDGRAFAAALDRVVKREIDGRRLLRFDREVDVVLSL